jgi:hypothetical protein
MSVMLRAERRQPEPFTVPERLDGIYKVTEAFRSITIAWESVSTGVWSGAAIKSFAALARRVALDLSTLGCGTLDKAVVNLALALDGITVAGTINDQLIASVDYALAEIRIVSTQHLLIMDQASAMGDSDQAPMFLQEGCPRCAAYGVCAIMRAARKAKITRLRF